MFMRSEGIDLFDDGLKVRNDCKAGKWKIGDNGFLKGDLHMYVLQIDRLSGEIGSSGFHNWLRIWFLVAPSSTVELPQKLVCSTLVKTSSLDNLVSLYMASLDRVKPSILMSEFVQKSTVKNGVPLSYYTLQWSLRDLTPDEIELKDLADDFMKQRMLVDLTSQVQEVLEPSSKVSLLTDSD